MEPTNTPPRGHRPKRVDGPTSGDGPEIRRGIPQGSETRVAALYWEAFGRKLGAAMNPPDKARAFIASHIHHDRGVAALVDGEVAGVAGYQLAERALIGGGAGDILATYGTWRGLPRLALLALMERRPADGELVMDGIAVAPEHRGKGIGSLLLREIAGVAADHSCRRVRLDVIDVNPRARALYERHGFLPVHTEKTPYLRKLMGFGAVTTMHRPIAPGMTTNRQEA